MTNKTSNKDKYDIFAKKGGLKLLRFSKNKITEIEIEKYKIKSTLNDYREVYLSYVQKLLSYSYNSNLVKEIANKDFLEKKATLRIPKKWLDVLIGNSIYINRQKSSISFAYFISLVIIRSIMKGFFSILKLEKFELNEFISEENAKQNKTILINPKFPQGPILLGNNYFDFGSWYATRVMKDQKFTFVHFDSNISSRSIDVLGEKIKCEYFKNFHFGLNPIAKSKLVVYAFIELFRGLTLSIKGDICRLVIFEDLINSKRFELVKKQELPNKIIFADNHGINMPYWVKTLEKQGTKIEFIFFSATESPHVYLDEDPRSDYWKLNQWPNIYCVDHDQQKFILQNIVNQRQSVEVYGFPYFTDCEYTFSDPIKSIAVFDYEPGSNHFGISTMSELGYNSYETNRIFIKTIYDIAKELNFKILHKPKRSSTLQNRNTSYKSFISSLDSKFYESVPVSVSPFKLIEKTAFTISMPLTTTGFIAHKLGKKSIFFDPLGRVDKYDSSLRGNLLISNPIELKKIFFEIEKKLSKGS